MSGRKMKVESKQLRFPLPDWVNIYLIYWFGKYFLPFHPFFHSSHLNAMLVFSWSWMPCRIIKLRDKNTIWANKTRQLSKNTCLVILTTKISMQMSIEILQRRWHKCFTKRCRYLIRMTTFSEKTPSSVLAENYISRKSCGFYTSWWCKSVENR
jgi:hypothetical protein